MATAIAVLDDAPDETGSQATIAEAEISEELIRQRAHQIWLDGGCQHGAAVRDWLEAEQQILQESEK